MLSNSEAYRARMKTLGVGYVLGRLKHPMKIQLRTANVEVIVQYQEWLFEKNCWGTAQLDQDRSKSAPHPWATSSTTTAGFRRKWPISFTRATIF